MLNLDFVKMHGIQNSFVIINDLGGYLLSEYPSKISHLGKSICSVNFGIGADGLAIISQADQDINDADFKITIINNDGSEAEMCGNVMRCLAKYVVDEELVPTKKGLPLNPHINFSTISGLIKTEILENQELQGKVKVDMGKPLFQHADFLSDEPKPKFVKNDFEFHCVSMGNPHAVVEVDDFDFDYHIVAEEVQEDDYFPNGVNVEFVKIIDDENIEIRVVERGVGETYACGTGACASVVTVCESLSGKNNINDKNHFGKKTVSLLGGKLEIEYPNSGERVLMTGLAEAVGRGTYFFNANF